AVVPSGNITVTVDPGSDVPLTVVSSLVTSSNVGASGAVVSVTVVVTESEIFPLLSIAATNNSSPPVNFTFSGIAIEYSLCALAFQSAVLPSGSVIVNVVTCSVVPIFVLCSFIVSFTFVASVAVASTTVVYA